MSPILVRPVREQLEHDRIIRQLYAKFRRKYEVGINLGREETTPVGSGPSALFPDLVLMGQERGHRLQAVIEVETGESVNHLEALAQWAHFAKLRAAFYLYVPFGMVDVARQLCDDNQIQVTEIWSYHAVGDELRFALVHRSRETAPVAPRERSAARPAAPNKTAKKAPVRKAPASPVDRKKAAARIAKTARPAKSAPTRPAKKPKRK
ncbi:MAG TPA: hypothetical protein VG222_10340 [Vicinamibacterales bacterium]|nr:hypothetical protein [Vicinamibacterales bacterium]